ncbi:hypothetical protein GQ53DRAFT_752760 [Thozetella sp. PMI_491]|nr:hypothetical protein GQ53DRAFT_752760 [Thozetella sp. PMI_491]
MPTGGAYCLLYGHSTIAAAAANPENNRSQTRLLRKFVATKWGDSTRPKSRSKSDGEERGESSNAEANTVAHTYISGRIGCCSGRDEHILDGVLPIRGSLHKAELVISGLELENVGRFIP